MFRPLPSRGHRPGNVVPVVCVMLVFLVGMVAFAIDTGYIAVSRTELQRAADAGALAGCEKVVTYPGQAVPEASAKTEAKTFIGLNESMTVLDADLRPLRYDPSKPAGHRVSYSYTTAAPPNGMEVTLRRDATANGRLPLFFSPLIGTADADVRARSTAYMMPGKGMLPGVPMIPFTMHIDYYMAAIGQEKSDPGGKPITLADNYTVRPDLSVAAGADGVSEVVLFSSTQTRPGNFGTLDIGSASNGTPELQRQILYGPTRADFQDPDFRDQVAADGSLNVPFTSTGDTGMSASTKEMFSRIFGLPRIIPLYDTVVNPGNGATYTVVAFATVVVLDVDFNGSPKRLWVQPTKLFTNKVTAGDLNSGPTYGVYTAPRLVVP